MPTCLRPSCGHLQTAHDEYGLCSLCMCAAFLHPDDALVEEPAPYVVDDEDEMELPAEIDFDGDADR